jgi:RNA ligase
MLGENAPASNPLRQRVEIMAHVTDLGFTLDDLENCLATDQVRSQTHPEFPELSIFNYTENVQYKNLWNKVTLACRGLILNNQTGEVVARPWEKFFNFGQRDLEIDFYAPVEVTDKVDGSLGILYRQPDGDWAIATRGSFASEQAAHANTLLYSKYADWLKGFVDHEGETYLFEIVYPENRIVVNYGDMDDLVMLGSVNKKYGYYYGPREAAGTIGWPGPVAEVFDYPTFADAISAPDRAGKEGYVIRSGSKIVKLKQADYVELHRIVTNLSPKTIWEMLSNGKTVAGICEEIPDEFHKYVEDIGNGLLNEVAEISYAAMQDHLFAKAKADVDGTIVRKRYADIAKNVGRYPGLMFNLLDGKDISTAVWKLVKPRGDVKSLVEDEG